MRILLSMIAVSCCAAMQGQTVLPILSYTPPTSGCNGLVALGLSAWNDCASGAYTMAPMGCAQLGASWSSGDTLYLPICSDPCEIAFSDGMGNGCLCGVGMPLAIVPSSALERLTVVRSGDDLLITAPAALDHGECRIYAMSGQVIAERSLPAASS